MTNHAQVYVFGDQTSSFEGALSKLIQDKEDSFLSSFFERTCFALRREVARLPLEERAAFPSFNTIGDLLAKYAGHPKNPALDMAFACIHQFALYIRQSLTCSDQPKPAHTLVLGFCIGLLTGATVSSCESLLDLLPAAIEVVLLAFRTGHLAGGVGNRIEKSKRPPSVWSAMAASLSEERGSKMLEDFNTSKALSPSSKLYVSAIASSCVTISGPPSILEEFIRVKKLSHSKLSIGAPYHAPHLYSETDVIQLVATLSPALDKLTPRLPLLSSVSGEILHAKTFKYLIQLSLQEILYQQLCLDKINDGVVTTLGSLSVKSCNIIPIATDGTQSLATALRKADLGATITCSAHELQEEINQSGRPEQSKLAIIGYSGRFPSAKTNEEFWQLVHEGRDVHSITPATRWNVETHVDPTGKRKNTSATPYGCWLEDPGHFDARFFNITPREAPQVDPAQRLALMSAFEAIEMAGLVPDSTPSTTRSRVGVFIGSTSNDWCETNSAQNVDTYFIPGGNRAFIPGRINYFFKFSGPSYSVDTACSSSLAAIHVACNALWRGDCDTVIAGGTNVMTNPDVTAGLDRGHFLSRTGNCKTFDDGADGYCRGEGIGIVVIKRLEDAIADNDPIQACILGAFTNHSAEAESITRPHVGAQQDILKTILTKANIAPTRVGYVEMHGTGTVAGDNREMQSVLDVFAPCTGRNVRQADQKLFIGSVKSNIGHGESASGVSALIKVMLMMKNNEIPPHCGIKSKINSSFPLDFNERNVHIAMKATPWHRSADTRRVMINNFSAAGGNSSLLLEDAPVIPPRQRFEDIRTSQIVAVSAKSAVSLKNNITKMIEFIASGNDLSLQALSYTTTARRIHHKHRLMVAGSGIGEIGMYLRKSLAQELPAPGKPPQIAFTFTGQGQQYSGMGQYFYQTNSSYRWDIQRLDAIATGQGFPSIMPYLQGETGNTEQYSPLTEQLAMTCSQIALAQLWIRWGVTPSVVVGHSLGEYAALNIAGVLSDSDTIWACGKRAELLMSRCTIGSHAMVAVSGDLTAVYECLADQNFEVACENSPSETVLCGAVNDVDQIMSILKQNRYKATRLNVPYAFHSRQVEPILAEFGEIARGVTFHEPQVAVLSPLYGSVVTAPGTFSGDYLKNHCRKTVNLAAAVDAAVRENVLSDEFHIVEIGPRPVVANLLKATMGPKTKVLPSMQRGMDSSKVIAGSLATLYMAGVDVRWNEYQRDYSPPVINLPSYSWELKDYWMQYVHDWSLRKGEPLPISGIAAVPRLESTTCCQEVLSEKFSDKIAEVTIESDLQRSDLDRIMRAHRVNNVAMCTSTVYGDIAFTLGRYLRTMRGMEGLGVVVQQIDVKKPLLTKRPGTFHKLQATIKCNWQTQKAELEYHSVEDDGKKKTLHAVGSLVFVDDAVETEALKRRSVEIKSRIKDLKQATSEGPAMRLSSSAAYRLFGLFVQYDQEFRGLREITLNSDSMEACSTISFTTSNETESPSSIACLMDSFGQTAGFTMNANDSVDLDKEVHLNSGCNYMYFSQPVDPSKEYETHVRMELSEGGLWLGDVTILQAGEAVGLYSGIKFQAVPRRLLSHIIGSNGETNSHQKPQIAPTSCCSQGDTTETTPSGATSVSTESTASTVSLDLVLTIICEESGIPLPEMKDDTTFAEMGVDSLLTLMIASRFREDLELDLEPSFFVDHPTVGALKRYFSSGGRTPDSSKDYVVVETQNDFDVSEAAPIQIRAVEPTHCLPSEAASNKVEGMAGAPGMTITQTLKSILSNVAAANKPQAKSTSIVLQGMPKKAKKTLFLFPDGCGSASSYGQIPKVHPDIAIVGLNCPYMKNPEDMTGTLEDMAGILLAEVRRRQPYGPYYFGGWSAGGVLAYSAAQQLLEVGETVERLILIDSPCPVNGFERLPVRFVEYCDSIHLFGEYESSGLPPWLLPHFAGINEILHAYKAVPFPGLKGPQTHMIWACDAVDKYLPFTQKFKVLPSDPDDIVFLISDRTDFGTNGWHQLVGDDIVIEVSKGSNHFTIMTGEQAGFLAQFLRNALLDDE